MANDARIRQNNIQGTLSSTLTAAATTMVSAALANLQAITSTQHAVIVLDPGRANGAPEIVYVTAHTAASTKATVARGKEGTSARTHPTPLEAWLHAPSAFDYNQVKTSTSRPASPYAGQTIWERDKTDLRIFDGSSWKRATVSPPTVRATRVAVQSINNNAFTAVSFDTKDWDTNGIFSTGPSGTKLICKTAGKYLISLGGGFAASTSGTQRIIAIQKNTTVAGSGHEIEAMTREPKTVSVSIRLACSQLVSLTTGQFIRAEVYQDSGGALNTGATGYQPRLSMLWVST